MNNILEEYPLFNNSEKFKETWELFREFRNKELKKKLTPLSERMALKRLMKLSNGNIDIAIAIVEQSIANSWRGLFPLRDKIESKKNNINSVILRVKNEK